MSDSSKITFGGDKAGTTPIFLLPDGGVGHTFIVGITGRGRSPLLEAEAARRGTSYDELLKEMEPTEEEKETARMQDLAEKERKAKRLEAVREAYWQASSADDFHRLHDALVSTVMENSADEPTAEQIKALFLMLPAQIIGLGISWGFSDTEVGDDICSFINENREAVIERLGLGKA